MDGAKPALACRRAYLRAVSSDRAEAGGRNDQWTHAVTRDDFDRLVGTAGAPQVGAQVLVGLRAQLQALYLVMLAVEVALAGREQHVQDLQRFVETLARLALVDAEAFVFTTPESATDAADDLALGPEEGVEHVDVFGNAYRVVPRQHRDHGAEIDALGDTRHVGQVLQRIGDHGVGREVMLDGPQRIEAGIVGDARDVEFFQEDVAVGLLRTGGDLFTALLRFVAIPVGIVLIEYRGAYAHGW